MQDHYLKEDDIMQVGQSCIDHTAYFTNWDFTRQRDHKKTIKDDLGLQCKTPNNKRTCPESRRCVSSDLCPEDNPDWTDMQDIQDAWGMQVLIPLSDQGISGEAALAALEERTIPYTFETHKVVLNPETAYLQPTGETTGEPFVGNWPYIWPYTDQQYLEACTKVTWSVGGNTGGSKTIEEGCWSHQGCPVEELQGSQVSVVKTCEPGAAPASQDDTDAAASQDGTNATASQDDADANASQDGTDAAASQVGTDAVAAADS
jgi:hypothetical protein